MKRELKFTDGVNALTVELKDTIKNELKLDKIFGVPYAEAVHME